jgi:serine/threonine-protein kinase
MPDDEVLTLARARIGTVLRGKYRLDRVLGVGGMAVVYAATHRNKKRFAIKMLHPELSMRENIRTRFLREGYVANSVGHPGAVAVLDDDVAEDGSAFVVMELLDGAPVDEVMDRHGKRVPLGLVLSIADALLDVLAAAHAKGVVHRDIKPANLFLTSDGRLEVLDFGIARLHDETSSAAGSTQTGAMMGTPAYMAPEQALAETSKIDGQTDLWAVGATMFTLLTGELVHAGDNASQLMVAAATKKAREISSVSEEVPKKVGAVIDKALAFDKKERWASAREMREALRQVCVEVTGGPIAPLPKTEPGAQSVTGLEATVASQDKAPSASSDAAFEPTVSAEKAPPSLLGPRASAAAAQTGAALSKSQPGTPAPPRALPWRAIGGAVLAIGVVGGGAAAYRAAHAPRVHYCVAIDEFADGPRCLREVGPEVLGKRGLPVPRVTEVGGRVIRVEWISFAGRLARNLDGDPTVRVEVSRDDAGAVREEVFYNAFGAVTKWLKWSDGGRRIDSVDIDGESPRHIDDDRATSMRVEYDAKGRRTKVRNFGPTGRPRSSARGGIADTAFGEAFEYGAKSDISIKDISLGADGEPAPDALGIARMVHPDDGQIWNEQSAFDAEGHPIAPKGVHTWRFLHDDYEMTGFSCFGINGEPVTNLNQAFHEARHKWSPATRTWEWTIFDEKGQPEVVRGLWFLAIRQTFDERGRMGLAEFLDGQGNRVVVKDGASAIRFAYDDADHETVQENLDPSGASMLGATGYVRRETKHDAHDNPIERRFFDEAKHPAPWREGGAIRRATFDDRDLRLTTADFDADDHPVANSHGYSSSRTRYDKLRNVVEEAYFGVDGKPAVSDEGFAVRRHEYDENDDEVAVSFFDASGAPTLFESAYAVHKMKYDERGLLVEEQYLDVHGEPAMLKDGYSSAKKARDRNGDVIEEAFFGKRGEPVMREGGYAVLKTKLDVTRRPIEVSLFDVAGKPVRGAEGWSIERTTYDARGLVMRIDHLDASGAPALDQDGRASATRSWDPRGNMTEETSLDAAGKPIATRDDGFATKKLAYDARDEVTEEALFGTDGKPVSGSAGWAAARALRRFRRPRRGGVLRRGARAGPAEGVHVRVDAPALRRAAPARGVGVLRRARRAVERARGRPRGALRARRLRARDRERVPRRHGRADAVEGRMDQAAHDVRRRGARDGHQVGRRRGRASRGARRVRLAALEVRRARSQGGGVVPRRRRRARLLEGRLGDPPHAARRARQRRRRRDVRARRRAPRRQGRRRAPQEPLRRAQPARRDGVLRRVRQADARQARRLRRALHVRRHGQAHRRGRLRRPRPAGPGEALSEATAAGSAARPDRARRAAARSAAARPDRRSARRSPRPPAPRGHRRRPRRPPRAARRGSGD